MPVFPRIILFLLILIVAAPAHSACYTPEEAEAEQGIRIHSELMVIALNCQHLSPVGQQNLYVQYKHFTAAHQDLIAGYDATLLRHFQREGGNAEAQLHDLHTRFANDISIQSARQRPDIFCARYARRIPAALQFSRQQMEEWASTPYPGHNLTRPLCAADR